jgi:hypothetical protein
MGGGDKSPPFFDLDTIWKAVVSSQNDIAESNQEILSGESHEHHTLKNTVFWDVTM